MTAVKKDFVFATIPFTDTTSPLLAPAILKSVAIRAGRSAVTIDLNHDFMKQLDLVTDSARRHRILAFFRDEIYDTEIGIEVFDLLCDMARRIMHYQPKFVGLSVFTYNCQAAAKYLSWLLKKKDPTVKIVLGGAGILHHFNGAASWTKNLKNHRVIDEYIIGDGEEVLFQYLKHEPGLISGLGTDTWKQMTNQQLESQPFPDFEDYSLASYQQPVLIGINGSRGCVQKCTFCDVHVHWKKFSYRGGEHIFDEMIYVSQKYGVKDFHFGDSLINGNLREYRKLMSLLATHNQGKQESDKLKWYSFFIFRPKQSFKEQDWHLTSESGGRRLMVGIETLNDQVRRDMGKNFTNEDIDFAFQMAQKYGNIRFTLLFLTGYPTETDADHEFALKWWPKQVRYKDVINGVNTGTPLGILSGTPLEQNFHRLGLSKVGPHPEDWVNAAVDNTPQKRVRWNLELQQLVKQLGFRIIRGHDAHYIIDRMRNDHADI